MKSIVKKKPYQIPCIIFHTGLKMNNAMMITVSKKDYHTQSWSEDDEDEVILIGHTDYESSSWGNIMDDGITSGHQTYESSNWGE